MQKKDILTNKKGNHSRHIKYEKLSNMKGTLCHFNYLNSYVQESTQKHLFDFFTFTINKRNAVLKSLEFLKLRSANEE